MGETSFPMTERLLRSLDRLWLGIAAVAVLGFAGCASAPVTYKTRPDTVARAAVLQAVRSAPLDISVQEISAGGSAEKHDELTTLVGKNITDAVAGTQRLTLAELSADFDTGPVRAELDEVRALLRAITLNDAMPFGPAPPSERRNPSMTYQVGRIDRLADALGGDAVLFVFVRDQYSTGGRKAVMALAMIAGAAAGVAVTPAMGVTSSSAALVERDGTVLWFNNIGAAGLDLRTASGATAWVGKLLSGLPPLATGSLAPASPAPPTAESTVEGPKT